MTYAITPSGPDDGISGSRPVGRSQRVAAALSGLLIASALAVIIFAAFATGSASPLPVPALVATGQHAHPLVLPAPCKPTRHRPCGTVTPPARAAASPASKIVR